MKELSELQNTMINNWLKDAEKDTLQLFDINYLDEKLSSIIKSVEYEKPLSYYKRLEL